MPELAEVKASVIDLPRPAARMGQQPFDRRLVLLQSSETFPAEKENAFEEIVTDYYPNLISHAIKMVRLPHLAEEATQDTLTKVWGEVAAFQPESPYSFAAWIHKILQNTAVDTLRSEFGRTPATRKPQPVDDENCDRLTNIAAAQEYEPEQQLLYKETIGELLAGLDLPETTEKILIMKLMGFEDPDIQRYFNLSPDAVYGRIHRARKAAKEILRPSFYPKAGEISKVA